MEASYLDLGSFDTVDGNTKFSINSSAFSIGGLYHYPVGSFNLMAKLGYISQKVDLSTSPKIDGLGDNIINGLLLGAGFSYKLNKEIKLNTSINVATDTNFGGIGLNFCF